MKHFHFTQFSGRTSNHILYQVNNQNSSIYQTATLINSSQTMYVYTLTIVQVTVLEDSVRFRYDF